MVKLKITEFIALLNLFCNLTCVKPFHMTIICHLFFCLECLAPMGMENFKITPAQISASSQYDRFFLPSYGRLHYKGNKGAWAARVRDLHEWIQIDFGIVTSVTYVATQGRHNIPQWVTQYKLQYSNDGNSFQVFKKQGENSDKVRLRKQTNKHSRVISLVQTNQIY